MGDMSKTRAETMARLVEEHKGQETRLLDLRGRCDWTDFMIITTYNSNTHKRGLLKLIQDFAAQSDMPLRNRYRNTPEEAWVLMDLGEIVVHLMSRNARAFFDLEAQWAPQPRPTPPGA